MPQIFTDYYRKKYEAPILSMSAFGGYFAYLFMILAPFIIGYSTGSKPSPLLKHPDFYKKVSHFIEQPTVEFTNEMFIQMTQEVGGVTSVKTFCSVPRYQELNINTIPIAFISVRRKTLIWIFRVDPQISKKMESPNPSDSKSKSLSQTQMQLLNLLASGLSSTISSQASSTQKWNQWP